MEWSDVGKYIASAAPVLGGILMGPPGAAVGGAVKMVLGAMGMGDDSSPGDVMETFTKDPAVFLKLRELEAKERIQLIELSRTQLMAQVQDLQSARSREVEMAKLGHVSSYGPLVISCVIVLGFFGAFGLIIFYTIPEAVRSMVDMLIGALVASFTDVRQYFLGSSLGSQAKTKFLAMAEAIRPGEQKG